MQVTRRHGAAGSLAEPKISLITVVLNGAALIERCLRSVESQEYRNMEYIVLDGASTDGTQDIIGRYRSVIDQYRSRPDKGPYDAATQALALATGDMVGFVMSDDWLEPSALNKLAEMYHEHPDADVFCFGMREYRANGSGAAHKTRVFVDPPGERFELLDGLYCHGLARFYSTRIMKEQSYHSDRYPVLADRDLYVRLGKRRLKKARTSDVLYHALVHPGSTTTGGSSEHISRLLDETTAIATEHLADQQLGATDRKTLREWYCFNRIRTCWFLARSGNFRKATRCALQLAIMNPMGMVRGIVCWRMPRAYRPRVTPMQRLGGKSSVT